MMGYIVKFTSPGPTPSYCNSLVFDNGAQVGIGTVVPAQSNLVTNGSVALLNITSSSVGAGIPEVEISNTSGSGVALMVGNTSTTNNYNGIEGGTLGTNSGVFGLHTTNTGTGRGGAFVTNSSAANAYGVYAQMPVGSVGWAGYFSGDAIATGAFFNGSDIKLKSNILPIANAIDKLKQIKGVSYDYKPELVEKFGLSNKRSIGVLAQDIEAVFPELIKESQFSSKLAPKMGEPSTNIETIDVKTVNYTGLIPVLIEAIKEQQKQIETLQQQLQKR